MRITKFARELLEVIEDIYRRTQCIDGDFYDFDQMWASTALGFDGFGGSAMTIARTYVFIPRGYKKAYVYFGSEFAYECDVNEQFEEDLRNHNIAAVRNSGKYKNIYQENNTDE